MLSVFVSASMLLPKWIFGNAKLANVSWCMHVCIHNQCQYLLESELTASGQLVHSHVQLGCRHHWQFNAYLELR